MGTLKSNRCGNRSILAAAITVLFSPVSVSGAACPAGLVIRQAAPADLVCVTPESKRRVAAENARAPLLWVAGPYGAKTCAAGYVWRQAFQGDLTCVTTDVRSATLVENNNPRGDPKP